MEKVRIQLKRVEGCEDLPVPLYMSKHASGMDLVAAVKKDVKLDPGCTTLIPTGLQLAIPPGFEAQIRPRSGLAWHHGISLLNSPGTIDADFRGEIKLVVVNLGKQSFLISRGDRIAQMVINRVYQAEFDLVTELKETVRSSGGFGHTGR